MIISYTKISSKIIRNIFAISNYKFSIIAKPTDFVKHVKSAIKFSHICISCFVISTQIYNASGLLITNRAAHSHKQKVSRLSRYSSNQRVILNIFEGKKRDYWNTDRFDQVLVRSDFQQHFRRKRIFREIRILDRKLKRIFNRCLDKTQLNYIPKTQEVNETLRRNCIQYIYLCY